MRPTASSAVVLLLIAAVSSFAQGTSGSQPASASARAQIDPRIVHLGVTDGDDLRFVRLSRSQGLSQQRVTHIVQDDRGFLWFIYEDRHGIVWMGTTGALNRVRSQQQESSLTSISRGTGSQAMSYLLIEEPSGEAMWIGTDGEGLYRLDTTNNRLQAFRHDPRGSDQPERQQGDSSVLRLPRAALDRHHRRIEPIRSCYAHIHRLSTRQSGDTARVSVDRGGRARDALAGCRRRWRAAF